MGNTRRNPDWSTINLGRLKDLPVYDLPSFYHLQDDPGNGCAGDPPGYPTYYTRNVYTRSGNNPGNGPQMVILFEGKCYVVESSNDSIGVGWDQFKARRDERMRSLWTPLPASHERTRLWMQETYSHQHKMYLDEKGVYQTAKDSSFNQRWNSFVYPVPSYRLAHFHDDPRFSEEWRTGERASVETKNAELRSLAAQVATPDNHCAVRIIRRFYPEHEPIMEWIEKSPGNPGNWWETATERPTPENCPGQYSMKHPCNGSWCQWCGWRDAA